MSEYSLKDLLELFDNNAWSPAREKPRSSLPSDNRAKKAPASRIPLSPKLAALKSSSNAERDNTTGGQVDNPAAPVFEWDQEGADGKSTTFRGTEEEAKRNSERQLRNAAALLSPGRPVVEPKSKAPRPKLPMKGM